MSFGSGSIVATVPTTSSPSADTRRSPESVIASGAELSAAVSTAALSLNDMLATPRPFGSQRLL